MRHFNLITTSVLSRRLIDFAMFRCICRIRFPQGFQQAALRAKKALANSLLFKFFDFLHVLKLR